jgi:hypothetical protein
MMQLIAPDILAEARGLSLSVPITGLVLGWLLWLFGWRWHRFWTVVGVTIAGGLYGLSSGEAGNGHVIALGLLVAVCAGLMALEIARIIAFVAGGTAVWWTAGLLFPKAQELWVFFLAGGLVGILFYRLWTMTFTSFLGTLIASHSLLALIESLTQFDVVTWSSRNPIALSVAVGILSTLGLAAQGAQYRWSQTDDDDEPHRRKRRRRRDRQADETPDVKALRDAFAKPQ